jgi:AraC-like DNA-binding protein/quercetin dioxygenase-like cupin family protein
MNSWLERNKGKNHWSVSDCFPAGYGRIRVFTHRNYRIGLHTHEFLEINIVADGTGEHYMEGKSLQIGPGSAFVIPPLVEHGYIDHGGLNVYHILLHPDYVAENLSRFRWLDGYLIFFTVEPYFRTLGNFRHGLTLSGDDLSEVFAFYHKIEAENEIKTQDGLWARECWTSLLIIRLCRAYAATVGNIDEYREAYSHMNAIVAAMQIAVGRKAATASLGEMAKTAGLERSYFCRVFKNSTGLTPMEFVRIEKIKEARKLLLEGAMNIGEIALELGYSDAAHFSRSFRAATGHPPSELIRNRSFCD